MIKTKREEERTLSENQREKEKREDERRREEKRDKARRREKERKEERKPCKSLQVDRGGERGERRRVQNTEGDGEGGGEERAGVALRFTYQ